MGSCLIKLECHADALPQKPGGHHAGGDDDGDDDQEEEGQLGNLVLTERGAEGATPAMRAALVPSLQQHLDRYSFKATAAEVHQQEQKLRRG